MKLSIQDIKVGKRFRQDMGDLRGLADSIEKEGLLQPIGVTENNDLVFGQRRLEAYKLLGRTEIPAKVVRVSSPVAGEWAENEVRKDFTLPEKAEIYRFLKLDMPNRAGRPAEGEEAPGRSDEEASKKAGFENPREASRALKILDRGPAGLLEAVEQGKVSLSSAAQLADEPKETQAKAMEKLARGEKVVMKTTNKKRNNSRQLPRIVQQSSEETVEEPKDDPTAIPMFSFPKDPESPAPASPKPPVALSPPTPSLPLDKGSNASPKPSAASRRSQLGLPDTPACLRDLPKPSAPQEFKPEPIKPMTHDDPRWKGFGAPKTPVEFRDPWADEEARIQARATRPNTVELITDHTGKLPLDLDFVQGQMARVTIPVDQRGNLDLGPNLGSCKFKVNYQDKTAEFLAREPEVPGEDRTIWSDQFGKIQFGQAYGGKVIRLSLTVGQYGDLELAPLQDNLKYLFDGQDLRINDIRAKTGIPKVEKVVFKWDPSKDPDDQWIQANGLIDTPDLRAWIQRYLWAWPRVDQAGKTADPTKALSRGSWVMTYGYMGKATALIKRAAESITEKDQVLKVMDRAPGLSKVDFFRVHEGECSCQQYHYRTWEYQEVLKATGGNPRDIRPDLFEPTETLDNYKRVRGKQEDGSRHTVESATIKNPPRYTKVLAAWCPVCGSTVIDTDQVLPNGEDI